MGNSQSIGQDGSDAHPSQRGDDEDEFAITRPVDDDEGAEQDDFRPRRAAIKPEPNSQLSLLSQSDLDDLPDGLPYIPTSPPPLLSPAAGEATGKGRRSRKEGLKEAKASKKARKSRSQAQHALIPPLPDLGPESTQGHASDEDAVTAGSARDPAVEGQSHELVNASAPEEKSKKKGRRKSKKSGRLQENEEAPSTDVPEPLIPGTSATTNGVNGVESEQEVDEDTRAADVADIKQEARGDLPEVAGTNTEQLPTPEETTPQESVDEIESTQLQGVEYQELPAAEVASSQLSTSKRSKKGKKRILELADDPIAVSQEAVEGESSQQPFKKRKEQHVGSSGSKRKKRRFSVSDDEGGFSQDAADAGRFEHDSIVDSQDNRLLRASEVPSPSQQLLESQARAGGAVKQEAGEDDEIEEPVRRLRTPNSGGRRRPESAHNGSPAASQGIQSLLASHTPVTTAEAVTPERQAPTTEARFSLAGENKLQLQATSSDDSGAAASGESDSDSGSDAKTTETRSVRFADEEYVTDAESGMRSGHMSTEEHSALQSGRLATVVDNGQLSETDALRASSTSSSDPDADSALNTDHAGHTPVPGSPANPADIAIEDSEAMDDGDLVMDDANGENASSFNPSSDEVDDQNEDLFENGSDKRSDFETATFAIRGRPDNVSAEKSNSSDESADSRPLFEDELAGTSSLRGGKKARSSRRDDTEIPQSPTGINSHQDAEPLPMEDDEEVEQGQQPDGAVPPRQSSPAYSIDLGVDAEEFEASGPGDKDLDAEDSEPQQSSPTSGSPKTSKKTYGRRRPKLSFFDRPQREKYQKLVGQQDAQTPDGRPSGETTGSASRSRPAQRSPDHTPSSAGPSKTAKNQRQLKIWEQMKGGSESGDEQRPRKQSSARKPKKSKKAASSSADGAGRGEFSKSEKAEIRRIVKIICNRYELSEEQIKTIIGENPVAPSSGSNEIHKDLWQGIADVLPDRTRKRFMEVVRKMYNNLVTGPWSQEENEQLLELRKQYGDKWTVIGAHLNRDPKRVRDHWRDVLLPLEKGETFKKSFWSAAEEAEFLQVIHKCLKTIEAGRQSDENAQTYAHLSNEQLLNWDLVSKHFGYRRSRLQCREKWFHLRDRDDIGEELITQLPSRSSWRLDKARHELRNMTPKDKASIVRAVLNTDATTDREVPWQKIIDKEFRNRFQRATLVVLWARLKQHVPDYQSKSTLACAEYISQQYAEHDKTYFANLDLSGDTEEEATLLEDEANLGSAKKERTPRQLYRTPVKGLRNPISNRSLLPSALSSQVQAADEDDASHAEPDSSYIPKRVVQAALAYRSARKTLEGGPSTPKLSAKARGKQPERRAASATAPKQSKAKTPNKTPSKSFLSQEFVVDSDGSDGPENTSTPKPGTSNLRSSRKEAQAEEELKAEESDSSDSSDSSSYSDEDEPGAEASPPLPPASANKGSRPIQRRGRPGRTAGVDPVANAYDIRQATGDSSDGSDSDDEEEEEAHAKAGASKAGGKRTARDATPASSSGLSRRGRKRARTDTWPADEEEEELLPAKKKGRGRPATRRSAAPSAPSAPSVAEADEIDSLAAETASTSSGDSDIPARLPVGRGEGDKDEEGDDEDYEMKQASSDDEEDTRIKQSSSDEEEDDSDEE